MESRRLRPSWEVGGGSRGRAVTASGNVRDGGDGNSLPLGRSPSLLGVITPFVLITYPPKLCLVSDWYAPKLDMKKIRRRNNKSSLAIKHAEVTREIELVGKKRALSRPSATRERNSFHSTDDIKKTKKLERPASLSRWLLEPKPPSTRSPYSEWSRPIVAPTASKFAQDRSLQALLTASLAKQINSESENKSARPHPSTPLFKRNSSLLFLSVSPRHGKPPSPPPPPPPLPPAFNPEKREVDYRRVILAEGVKLDSSCEQK
ncbi:hypothetical protein GWI33_016909 [Rhynchophorus ferrugineus]|uniref:Uncharacterized protein n=1 Tax=Rhynchophorus ferrugineus TaxID=354439 RepID=A0A834HZ79_RHYFE|nr:hypothetical protein GWI33_016909 [Rhynchophorus ferrugineus]